MAHEVSALLSLHLFIQDHIVSWYMVLYSSVVLSCLQISFSVPSLLFCLMLGSGLNCLNES